MCRPYSRFLTGISILVVIQNLRWKSNKTSLFHHLKYLFSLNFEIKISTVIFTSIIFHQFISKLFHYLKWILRTPTVMKMENVTRSIVKRRYFPNSGTARDVGGIISASSKKNTVNERRIEIHRVTCIKCDVHYSFAW